MVRLSRNRLNMEDGRIDRAAFKDYGEIAIGSSSTVFTGSSYAINIENGNTYNLVLNDDCSFTFANPTGSGALCSFTMILKQDQVGNWSVTWPAAVRWQGTGGSAPTLPTAPGDFDILTFFTYDGGSTWFGFVADRSNSTAAAELWVWGRNNNGQLGLGDTADRSSPTQVGSDTDWTNVAGSFHSLARKIDGTLWAWGLGTNGRLGLDSTASASSPTQVGSDTDWVSVLAGYAHSAALKSDGTLWTWGSGYLGRTGLNTTANVSSPAQVGALTNWAVIDIGYSNALALKTDGTLWAWGQNSAGQLGQNDTVVRSSPTQVGSDTDWRAVAGDYTSLAIKTDGTLWAWGAGQYGQLGLNDTNGRSSPTQVGSDTDWEHVITHTESHTLALKTDGTLWAWGLNDEGRLGLNDISHRSSPTQVGSDTAWVAIGGTSDTFEEASFALKTDGTLWTWGKGFYGQLGTGDTSNHSSPTQIGSGTNWASIAKQPWEGGMGLRFPAGS